MHKFLLALIATALVIGVLLFAINRTSHAPEKTPGKASAPSPAVVHAPSRSGPIDETRVVDMTYDFDDKTIYWPNAKPFVWEKESWGKSAAGYWYSAGRYAASEHGGTHLDAPIHFAEGRQTMDEIPLSRLIGSAIVIDISSACEKQADYRLSVDDIDAWEKQNGRIPDNAIVLIRTGWGKYWGDRKKYLGSDAPGDVANLHFPGISSEAAELMARQRKIDGVGVDTASLDYGPSRDFIAHQIFNGANIYGLENIAHLERLPERGAFLIALPMKIKGGSGGPVRIIAVLP